MPSVLSLPLKLGQRAFLCARASREPTSARLLLFRGVTGRFEMWDAELPYPRMVGDIEAAAGLTVEEPDERGLQVRRWKPFPGARVRPLSAIQGVAGTTPPADGENA